MVDPIVSSPTSPIIGRLLPKKTENMADTGQKAVDGTFGQYLKDSMAQVNQLQQEADVSAQELIAGKSKDIHGTMIEMQKASIAFELAMQVRNKVIAAYDEIKRMQF